MLFGCCTNFLTCDKRNGIPMHLISPEELASAIADRLARQSAVPRRTGWPLRQRQNDAGRTADRAFSSKHRRPHRRLLSPAIPASHRLGEDSLCANMDIQRLRMRSSLPPGQGQAFSYQAYSCREGAYLPPRPLGPAPLVIVELQPSPQPCTLL